MLKAKIKKCKIRPLRDYAFLYRFITENNNNFFPIFKVKRSELWYSPLSEHEEFASRCFRKNELIIKEFE